MTGLRKHGARALALLLVVLTVGTALAEDTVPVQGVEVPLKDVSWPVAMVVSMVLAGRWKPTLRIEHHVTGDPGALDQLRRVAPPPTSPIPPGA